MRTASQQSDGAEAFEEEWLLRLQLKYYPIVLATNSVVKIEEAARDSKVHGHLKKTKHGQ